MNPKTGCFIGKYNRKMMAFRAEFSKNLFREIEFCAIVCHLFDTMHMRMYFEKITLDCHRENLPLEDSSAKHTVFKRPFFSIFRFKFSIVFAVGTGQLSIIIKNSSLGRFFVGVQFSTALIISLLAIWMWTQIHNLNDRDIPYWSGGLVSYFKTNIQPRIPE